MKAIVIQFRRGRKTYTPRHFLIDAGMKDKQEAGKLVGKAVEWKGRIIKGKIAATHGNKGIVRAIFEKGLPGQALTTEAEIKE